MKKVLALVLALMMAVSLMVTANAAVVVGDADEIDPKYQEAVDVLAQLGIIEGKDPTNDESETDSADKTIRFDPKGAFDRASFAKILFILYTGADPKDDRFAKYAYDSFEDVTGPYKDWALVPINYLNEIGVMIGVGNNKFEPDRVITGYEAVKGLVQAIGRGKLGEINKDWNAGLIDIAVEGEKRHITTGLGLTLSDPLTREQVAGLVFNTLTNEEAYKVTYTEGTGYYVEDGTGYNKDKRVTLGEANWELHPYGKESGKTYPSDKKVNIDLDPFGRPTNPKWVAVVDGNVVEIGKGNKAILTYYQRDKILRKELAADLYREFAFKDDWAGIEYYVDGQPVNDPWEHRSIHTMYSELDKIGGTGVTVEVYLMDDDKVAISPDELNVGDRGETDITSPDGYPRLRIVIVHHYAAEITKQMMIPANAVTGTGAHVEVPFERFTYSYAWCDICEDLHPATYRSASKVSIPNNGKYEEGDVVYFDVAIEEDKYYETRETAYNDVNLTDTEGCVLDRVIKHVDVDNTYIRLAGEKDDDPVTNAMYFNYFMQTTLTEAYKAENVELKTTKQKVYLEPTKKEFVALIVSDVDPYEAPDPSPYYYVESITIRVDDHAHTSSAATPAAAGTGTTYTEKNIKITADIRSVDGTNDLRNDEALDFELNKEGTAIAAIAGNKLVEEIAIADIIAETKAADHYDGYYYLTIDATNATKLNLDLEIGGATNTEKEPHPYKSLKKYTMLEDGRKVEIKEWYKLADEDNKPVKDNLGKDDIFFAVIKGDDGKDVTVIYDQYKTTYMNGEGYDFAYVFTGPGAKDGPYFGFDSTDITKDNAVMDEVSKTVKAKNVGPVIGQFVADGVLTNIVDKDRKVGNGSSLVYAVSEIADAADNEDKFAYDDDASLTNVITSANFWINDSSPKVNVETDTTNDANDKNAVYYHNDDATVYVTEETPIYAYTRNADGTIKYYGTYRYNQYERFGAIGNREVLVATYRHNDANWASYIVVIADKFNEPATTYDFTGIYLGFDEIEGTTYKVYFLNPRTGKKVTYTSSVDQIKEKLTRRYVGQVYGITVSSSGEITKADVTVKKPATFLYGNSTQIITTEGVNTLHDPVYYYVGGDTRYGYIRGLYIAEVDASYMTDDTLVAVYDNSDGTTTVIIWQTKVAQGFDSDHPDYGNIDDYWDWREPHDPYGD